MKKLKTLKIILITGILFTTIQSCERDISDDAVPAPFTSNGEVYIDGFSAGLEYLPFAGTVQNAFSVDTETKYRGSSSMRFDVPNVGDPAGAFAGAIFPDFGGRDLSGYDALTFWAKSSQTGTINEIGFGNDFGENKYLTTLPNLTLSTNWRKYIIPLPDPSKLTRESGLFWYAEGPENGNGYTFWIDDLQYEKLGTVAQPQPKIFNGNDIAEQTFIGANINLFGLTQTFNLENGVNQTVSAAPSYFVFNSSDTSVATVSELGVIDIIGSGTTTITASLNGVDAQGSLTIESLGAFIPAPTPTRDPSNVISIFSDAYENVPVDFYNGYFAPFQTTQGQNDITINGDNIIKYTQLNFVATEFKNPTVDATGMTHLHFDVQIEDPVLNPGDFLRIQLGDFGPNAAFGGGDDTQGSFIIPTANLSVGSWLSFDLPLANFPGLTNRANLAQIFFVSDGTISTILVDNMYFYVE